MGLPHDPTSHPPSPDAVATAHGLRRPPDALPLHRLEVSTPATFPFAIGTFDTIGPMARATFPHRHTFYELAYVTEGSGTHLVDLAAWPLRPPQLYVVLPGQLHCWERVSNLRGWVVLFTQDFLLDHPGDRDNLRELGNCQDLDGTAATDTAALLSDMHEEYETRSAGFDSILRAYLHVLIVRAGRLPSRPRPGTISGPATVAREFTRLLGRAQQTRMSVHEYAAQLGVSVSYLTEAVKHDTGTTPGRHIRQAHALEAKRLLAGTELSVRQVAREVGFTDPAYFSRFFRRETGLTPGEFRERDRRSGKHNDVRAGSIAFPGNRS